MLSLAVPLEDGAMKVATATPKVSVSTVKLLSPKKKTSSRLFGGSEGLRVSRRVAVAKKTSSTRARTTSGFISEGRLFTVSCVVVLFGR